MRESSVAVFTGDKKNYFYHPARKVRMQFMYEGESNENLESTIKN